jgi:hypothetical protein
VFLYDVTYDASSVAFSLSAESVLGLTPGSKFGEAVGLADVVGDTSLDLVVGAPGVDGTGPKQTDYGEASVFGGLIQDLGRFAMGAEKNDNLGWQIAVAGQTVIVGSKWTSTTRRAEVYSALPSGAHRVLTPGVGNPSSLSDGWASGGITTGTIDGEPAAIIGAPNANCGGSGSTGVAYLYGDIDQAFDFIEPSDVFVPPVAVDPDGDGWNAFGWSNAIIETSTSGHTSSYVVIGEPGREGSDANGGQVYVYKKSAPPE